jgi:hypothetical protein
VVGNVVVEWGGGYLGYVSWSNLHTLTGNITFKQSGAGSWTASFIDLEYLEGRIIFDDSVISSDLTVSMQWITCWTAQDRMANGTILELGGSVSPTGIDLRMGTYTSGGFNATGVMKFSDHGWLDMQNVKVRSVSSIVMDHLELDAGFGAHTFNDLTTVTGPFVINGTTSASGASISWFSYLSFIGRLWIIDNDVQISFPALEHLAVTYDQNDAETDLNTFETATIYMSGNTENVVLADKSGSASAPMYCHCVYTNGHLGILCTPSGIWSVDVVLDEDMCHIDTYNADRLDPVCAEPDIVVYPDLDWSYVGLLLGWIIVIIVLSCCCLIGIIAAILVGCGLIGASAMSSNKNTAYIPPNTRPAAQGIPGGGATNPNPNAQQQLTANPMMEQELSHIESGAAPAPDTIPATTTSV